MADFDFSAELAATLRTYANGVAEAVDEAAQKVRKGTCQGTARHRPEADGRIRKRLDFKQTGANARGEKTYTVYNKAHYQLTHLLQNGHKGPAPAPAYPQLTARRKSGSKNSLPSARKRLNEKKHHTCPAC